MWPISLTSFTASVRNFESTERELLQPGPRPGGLAFLAGGLPLRPLPPSLFPSKYPSLFTQFQVFSTQVLAFVLPTCWVRHSHHASTSLSSTLLLTRLCPPIIPPLLAAGPTFSASSVSQLCYRRHGREIISLGWGASPPVDALGRLALSASTTSRINRCHKGTLIHARTLYYIARTPKVYSCRAACYCCSIYHCVCLRPDRLI